MKLSELNSITACEKLKSLLEDKLAVIKTKTYLNYPETSLPDNFVAISPNGGMLDRNDAGEGILLLDVCVKLLKDKGINNIKLTRILEVINEVITDSGIRSENYFFVLSPQYNFIDEMDYSLGYAVKSLNIFFRIERTSNY